MAKASSRVRVILPYEGQYLLQQMINPKYPENLFKLRCIGGGIEGGELPIEALVRELQEELFHIVTDEEIEYLGFVDDGKGGEYYFALLGHRLVPGDYTPTLDNDPIIRLVKGEPWGPSYVGPDISELLLQLKEEN